jgi:hypothetical protein
VRTFFYFEEKKKKKRAGKKKKKKTKASWKNARKKIPETANQKNKIIPGHFPINFKKKTEKKSNEKKKKEKKKKLHAEQKKKKKKKKKKRDVGTIAKKTPKTPKKKTLLRP